MMEPMAADTRIGTRIRRARERKRWTQQQLADAIGVNIKSVDNWENGRTSPRSSIGALEDVLGISFSEQEQPQLLSPRARKVLREELSEEDYRRVVGLAEGTLAVKPREPEPEADPRSA